MNISSHSTLKTARPSFTRFAALTVSLGSRPKNPGFPSINPQPPEGPRGGGEENSRRDDETGADRDAEQQGYQVERDPANRNVIGVLGNGQSIPECRRDGPRPRAASATATTYGIAAGPVP
jgi:hypothetical protein